MRGHSFIRQTKLTNVKGRIVYISSQAKQEFLYATYETSDRPFWNKLAKENREDFRCSGASGRCIEARELIISLPPSLYRYSHNELLKHFTEYFKSKYGVECSSALHHNKSRTNFHIHLVYSERELLKEPIEKLALRNMYFDEKGRHVRTKKEVTGESGNLRKGCKVISKGSVYERHLFEKKKQVFKTREFLNEVKQGYTELMNNLVSDREKLKVFDRNGPFMATKKIGKNNPHAEEIKADNDAKDEWNARARTSMNYGMPVEVIKEVKKSEIVNPIKESMKEAEGKAENGHVSFRKIVLRASKTLRNMLREFRRMTPEDKKKAVTGKIKAFIEYCRAPEQSAKTRDERDAR